MKDEWSLAEGRKGNGKLLAESAVWYRPRAGLPAYLGAIKGTISNSFQYGWTASIRPGGSEDEGLGVDKPYQVEYFIQLKELIL